MPFDKKQYPIHWEAIAFDVKQRADWKCQKCGKQCRKPGEKFDTHKNTLTVAHLNHLPMDISPENLMAMCAPCHLRYDAKHHAETRKRKKEVENGYVNWKDMQQTIKEETGLFIPLPDEFLEMGEE